MSSDAIVAFLVGVAGLFFALFPTNIENRGALFDVGLICVAAFLSFLALKFIPGTVWQLLFRRRLQLNNVCIVLKDELQADFDDEKIMKYIDTLALNGKIRLYGDLASSGKSAPIPPDHFKDHVFLWRDSFDLIRTVKPKTMHTNEGKEDGYLNIYADLSLLRQLRERLKANRIKGL